MLALVGNLTCQDCGVAIEKPRRGHRKRCLECAREAQRKQTVERCAERYNTEIKRGLRRAAFMRAWKRLPKEERKWARSIVNRGKS